MKRTLSTSALAAAALTIVVGLGGCGSESAPKGSGAQSDVGTPVADAGKPIRVEIPEIDVDEKLHGVGLNGDGTMEMPDFGDAGWYDLGPRPGAEGPAVVVAHVHSPAGPDVFWDLHKLEPGDQVKVTRTDGTSTFVIDGYEQTPKKDLPLDRIWSKTDKAVLRLVTCGGEFDPAIGGFPDNTIVYAHLA